MADLQQSHFGSGDNIGRDQYNYYLNGQLDISSRSKYLNSFAHYDPVNLVGRELHLQTIKDHLFQHNLLLLHGIGGIGKTTLAKAYIARNKDNYDHIAYVEIVDSIANSMLIKLGNSSDVHFVVDPKLDFEEKFQELINVLRHIPQLLLVLDNANDVDDLRLRKNQLDILNAKVLITGRAKPQSFIQEHNILEVEALTPEEGMRLFCSNYTSNLIKPDRLLVEQILNEAFYHPKLVEVIAKAAHANSFLNLKALKQIVEKKYYEDDEINYPIEIDNQTKKIYRILLDLFDTDYLSEEAQQILRYFAILPTIDISVQDLAILLQIDSPTDRQGLIINLNNLVRTGWLEGTHNRFFSMHGLVQWVIRKRLIPTAKNCEHLIKGIAKALFLIPSELIIKRQHFLVYTAELLSLFADEKELPLAVLYNNLAEVYGELGDYKQDLVYHYVALAIRESILSISDPVLATSYSNLASTYQMLGDYKQAFSYNQRAIVIQEEVLPSTHPDLARSYNNLAITYGALGDYSQCLNYHQKALGIWETVLPSTHPTLATSNNNLAEAYRALGNYEQALVFNQKAIAIQEEVLPSNHPDLAIFYTNIACNYLELGDYKLALFYSQKALFIQEKNLLPTHPNLALSYNNIGAVYSRLGDYQQCLYYLQKALIIRETMLPSTHPDLDQAYSNLSVVYWSLDNYRDSLEYSRKALSIREAVLPSTHPDLALSYNNLAESYGMLDDHEQRLIYHKKAMVIWESVLPPSHPTIASAYSNLAVTYGALGLHQKRLECNMKALAIREAVLPPNHLDLALTYSNLAFNYRALSNHRQALIYFQQALSIKELVLLPSHIDIAKIYSDLSDAYYFVSDLENSMVYIQKALIIYEQKMPLINSKIINLRKRLKYLNEERQNTAKK